MITLRRHGSRRIAGLPVGFALALLGPASQAQITVYDPAIHVQAVLTAARELQQVNNEIASLENQATMLVNEARNLASLPYSAIAPLLDQIQRTEQLLTQAQRIAYSVTTIDQAFTRTYPASYAGAGSSQMLTDADTRWANARVGFQDAMRVQAGAVQNLDGARIQLRALVGVSQSATGALQASQAGNQLVALQARQLADLTAVMAAIGRAQALEASRQVESVEQGRAQTANFLNYGAGYVPGSAQEFH